MKLNCILAGVGGQGTVLASKLIAGAAMEKGHSVRTAETIGMAQRGGSVVSHVRVGDRLYSPLVPKGQADLILGFEPGEAVRCLPYLKPGGTVIVASKAIRPVTDSLGKSTYNSGDMLEHLRGNVQRLMILDTDEIIAQTGSAKSLNVALLGAAAGCGALGLTVDEISSVIERKTPKTYLTSNQKALEAGIQAGKRQMADEGGVHI